MAFAQEIPVGTALPVSLTSTLDAAKAKPGQVVNGRLTQDVPLPAGKHIPRRSQVQGKVLAVRRPAAGTGSQVILQFDRIHTKGADFPISAGLRAIASLPAVLGATEPTSPPLTEMNPPSSWTTNQIGGEVVYRAGGQVMAGDTAVAKPVAYGVLGQFRPNPVSHCSNEGNDREQALGIFATTACGVYGYENLSLAHAGITDPKGQITLTSTGDVQLYSGSGLLLVTVGK
jgi:hypothetical protein